MMILLLFPILFFARVKFCETGLWRLKICSATLTFLICIVVFGLGLKYFVDPKRGSKELITTSPTQHMQTNYGHMALTMGQFLLTGTQIL